MTRQNHVTIIFRGIIQISVNVFVGVGKSFVPRADKFFFAGFRVESLNFAERVASLRVNEVDFVTAERVADVVVKRIGIKIAVNARYRDYDSFSRISE